MNPLSARQRLADRRLGWLSLLPRLRLGLGGLACTLLLALAPAYGQLAVPPLTAHVVDTTATLGAVQVQQLESKLSAFEQSHGAQIVMLLVPTTQPEDIASYANRVANSWKIGRKEIGDGLLVIVAKDDRKVRIEVAKTLEGAIPDLAAKQIIDQAISPRFKVGDFAGGLDGAADLIMARIKGEALPVPKSGASDTKAGFQWEDLAIFMFFAVPVVGAVARNMLGNKLGSLATGGAVGAIALVITSSLLIAALAGVAALLFGLFSGLGRGAGRGIGGWGGGSGGGFGGGGLGAGGGFGSGGGGDFGGGGASGDW